MNEKKLAKLKKVVQAVRDADGEVEQLAGQIYERFDEQTWSWKRFNPFKNNDDAMWLAAFFGIDWTWTHEEMVEENVEERLRNLRKQIVNAVIEYHY